MAQACVERILVLDRRYDRVVTIDVDDAHALPHLGALSELEQALATGEAALLEQDPYFDLRQPESVLERRYGAASWLKHRQRRDARWMSIAPIVAALQDLALDVRHLGALVQDAHERTGVSRTALYQYVRWYWQHGECRNALLPRYDRSGARGHTRPPLGPKRGRPRTATRIADAAPGINVNARVQAFFRRGTQLFYDKRAKWPLPKAFHEIEKRYFNIGYEYRAGQPVPILAPREQRPTLGQYRYWYEKKWDVVESDEAREGRRGFNLRRRAVPGAYRASLGSLGPGKLYQIDATIGDVFLVSELERQVIGRPI
jgi:putative transposase